MTSEERIKVNKILLVDDEKFILSLLIDILEDRAHTIITASNGKEALDMVRMEKPDLVISDVMMPIMNGFQLLVEIRANPETEELPFILLTVKDSPVDIKRGLTFKANYYFPKPFDDVQLLKAVDELALAIHNKQA
ncbi:response regulator [bacterium]|nr:response regulator [bacterium]